MKAPEEGESLQHGMLAVLSVQRHFLVLPYAQHAQHRPVQHCRTLTLLLPYSYLEKTAECSTNCLNSINCVRKYVK